MWFMGKNFTLVLGALCGAMLVACNGGGGSSSGGGGGGSDPDFATDPTPPSATMPAGTYNVNGESVPYSQLGQPIGLVEPYPNAFWPNKLQPSLQIAYGNNSESNIANLTAYVTMGGSLCSATPVKYDSVSGTTFLIGAAHCFVDNKTSATTLKSANLSPTSLLKVYYGVSKESANWTSYPVKAVYLRQDYCYNATFGIGGHCPNFSPSDGANTQGNDIAVIQISGQFGDPESYPQVVPASEYPTPYTAAPVLSVGYGLNTQTPSTSDNLPRSTMFYTANYQYWQQDSTPSGQGGYHYLCNSFYNSGGFEQSGYSALICGGDSGGGDLFWTGTKWILLSEHTYGPGGACGTFYTSLPNGATNVSAYYDWIQSILTNLAPAANCSAGNIVNCVTNG